jgi:hypothetical protein
VSIEDDILNCLPEVKFFRKCSNCGSNDWKACNLSSDNRVVINCNKCSEVIIGSSNETEKAIGPNHGSTTR